MMVLGYPQGLSATRRLSILRSGRVASPVETAARPHLPARFPRLSGQFGVRCSSPTPSTAVRAHPKPRGAVHRRHPDPAGRAEQRAPGDRHRHRGRVRARGLSLLDQRGPPSRLSRGADAGAATVASTSVNKEVSATWVAGSRIRAGEASALGGYSAGALIRQPSPRLRRIRT